MAPTLVVWTLGFFLLGNCDALNTRVAGGKPSSVQEYPSVVQVESYNAFTNVWAQICGGAILTSRFVVSAAQCFDGSLYQPDYRRIRAGTNVRHTGGQVSYVKRSINHPNYGQDSYNADITVVELIEALVFTPVVQQGVFVAEGSKLPPNTPVVMTGWGLVNENSLASNELRELTTLTADIQECRDYYSSLATPGLITDNMICMGMNSKEGNCAGDQGGPVYYDGIIVGIVSFGNACSSNHQPAVSTAVEAYTDWIKAVVNSP